MNGMAEVPKGWRELTLSEVCSAITDGTHYTPTYVDHGMPFYSVESVTNDDFVNVKHISSEEHRTLAQRCRPQCGDILMTRIGSLGETKYLDWNVEASIYVSLAMLRPGRNVDGRYLYAFTKSRPFVKAVEDRSLLWAAPKKINMGDIGHVPVLIPTDPNEQRAIADVLFAVEGQIKALERLIVKKQAVKQGMMQQLLTGKTRLPGFTAPWSVVRLGDHVGYVKTVPLSRAQLDGSSPLRYLHYGDIHTCTKVTLDAARDNMPRVSSDLARNAGRLRTGDLVLADASEDSAGVGRSLEITSVPVEGVVPGLHTIAARFDKAVLADGFKAYLQFVPAFRETLLRLAAGTKVLATTRSYVSSVVLSIPNTEEQVGIAQVLRDADAEIDALQVRLSKARDVKTGMMQELLSGRTRLVAMESVS